MREVVRIPLPAHAAGGGFDHAAVDPTSHRLYVAHTSNDSVDVLHLGRREVLRSLPGLRGVAGVWVNERRRLLFTSNRGEDTAAIFRIDDAGEQELWRTPTGARPNGMAFDPDRQTLLVAGVGDPNRRGAPPSLTFVDVPRARTLSTLSLPGRTRWALYHRSTDSFYVNVAEPASVVAIAADDVSRVARSFPIRAAGPHGLDQDPQGETLYCACDEGVLVALDVRTGSVANVGALSGPPDVVWVNPRLRRLYVAIGEPGVVDVFDLDPPRPSARVTTAPGAHTLTVDLESDEVHVFLPTSHEDLVLRDG